MLLELKSPLAVQLVERFHLLRNQIGRRAKGRAIATDALQDIPDRVIESSLRTLRDIKQRIESLAEPCSPELSVSKLRRPAIRCQRGGRRPYHGAHHGRGIWTDRNRRGMRDG